MYNNNCSIFTVQYNILSGTEIFFYQIQWTFHITTIRITENVERERQRTSSRVGNRRFFRSTRAKMQLDYFPTEPVYPTHLGSPDSVLRIISRSEYFFNTARLQTLSVCRKFRLDTSCSSTIKFSHLSFPELVKALQRLFHLVSYL